ncbi:Uncharacterised protein [Mycobacteroides abscessus subsp. massiliense]|nr:Uncharacterised protein [Mycobacteroides abscessus subsp. massiliense]
MRHNWEVTAAIPAKTMEAPVIPRLIPRLSVTSNPAEDKAIVMARARTAFIRPTTTSAA